MFDRDVNYPTAVASYDDDGVTAAIDWCVEHMQKGDTLSVWTSLKSNLRNCAQLADLVQRQSDVAHITGRGSHGPAGSGPVLMAWAGMDAIGELVRFGHGIRALCVIAWNEDAIRPWVTAVSPIILGDGSAWEIRTPGLDPVLVEALTDLTSMINHNNTIAAGDEKDEVVSVLLALKSAGISLDGEAMQGWALAHGWAGKNPDQLAKYARDINAGKRPRHRKAIRSDYVDVLQERIEPGNRHDC
ncbi:hypothetical protein [Mycolicibacterium gadium]|uniref:Uncharacterized protein n=1 Tax=Mycolicibacterium gadium TaxID=1794 RepID=A0A7I7WM47_MYCGU|nr:hypothetical protein [Mycolicibacterium gadium]BBZ18736.1 hypothetical protein MGAD_30710 [Mycolicibacterium gadium]